MATATTVRKSRGKKNEQKSQPKIYTFEWKGLNRDGKKTAGELRGASAAEIRSQLKSQGVLQHRPSNNLKHPCFA